MTEITAKFSCGFRLPPNHSTLFGTILKYLPTPRIAGVLLNMQYFSSHWSMQDFFTSRLRPDILMNVLKDWIIYSLLGHSGFCLIFILSKSRFSTWSLTENSSFISVHWGIWSRYWEINKFKIRKDTSFPK